MIKFKLLQVVLCTSKFIKLLKMTFKNAFLFTFIDNFNQILVFKFLKSFYLILGFECWLGIL